MPKKYKTNTQKIATPKELKERWEKKKNQIETLSSNIGRLRRDVAEDLKSEDEKKFLTALAIALIDKTGERVGNDTSAENGNFGVTGLRKKHINIDGDKITLTYQGKSGVLHDTSFSSSKLAQALKKAIKNSKGIRVFQTSDGFRIKNDGVNRYLESYDISAKDIRGYRSNDWIIKGISKKEIPQIKEQRQKTFSEVLKKVAAKIGHGKSTLRNHYMIPEIETSYINDGKIIDISDKEKYEKGGGVGAKNQEPGAKTKEKEKNMNIISDGTKGGLLYGPTDKNGGTGIPGEVIGGSNVVLGGGEVIINEEAAKQNCELLNEINTSTGGRVINCDNMNRANTGEFKAGGYIGKGLSAYEFDMPSRKIYNFAKNIKDNYSEIWKLGGNIAGNDSFKKLERVMKRGYWIESERPFYITWQAWMARHRGDFLIAGVVANIKWLSEVDKGWDYMKELIQFEIDKRYNKANKLKYNMGGNVNKHSLEEFNELIIRLQDQIKEAMAYGEDIKVSELIKLKEKVIDQRDAIYFKDGGEVLDSEITQSASKYGWSAIKNNSGDYELFNRKNTKVVLIKQKGSKYTFLDMAGNKLMSGNGMIGKSIEKLLTSYYYATPVYNQGGEINPELKQGNFILPKGHMPFIKVPTGGSSCANCKYLDKNSGGYICTNKYYKQWDGTGKLPQDVNNYCSDWFEPKQGSV